MKSVDGWKQFVEGNNNNNDMRKFEQEMIHTKMHCLTDAYEVALHHMGLGNDNPDNKSWQQCCESTLGTIIKIECYGKHWPTYHHTIQN